MTQFNKELFKFDGLFLMYDGAFVARFKRGGMASFKNFLIKNFSVEEYFQMCENMSPVEILATKGFVMPNTAKVLKLYGFEPISEGQKQYIASILSNRL